MENIEELLNEATELINEQKFVEAQSILKKCTNIEQNNIEVYKNLGLCEINLDNPQDALNAFSKAVEINGEDALSLFYLASSLARIGQKEEALKKFEKVIELRPDYLEAYKSLAMIYVEFAQNESAIELMEKALNNPNITPDYTTHYIIATCYMLKKDYKKAIEYLNASLDINPDHLPVLNSLSVCYMNGNELNKALEILNRAYELDKNNSLTAYNLGVCYQGLEDYKNALKYFQTSYQLEPSVTMLASLANCAFKAGEFALSSNLYQNLVAVYPNNTEYRMAYIESLEQIQKYKEALENINLLLALDEKNITLQKKKGTNLRKLGLNEESIATFTILLNRGKIDVEVYYNLAFNYVEMGDFDNAKEMFKKCIILEPNNPYAHKDLGVLYLKMNCYEWAVDEIQEAINLENDVGEFYYALGVAYMMLSRIDEAQKALEDSIKYDEQNPDAMAYLGYLHLMNKNYKQALDCLQKALSIDSENFLAKTHLAKYYFEIRKFEVAKELLTDIAEKVPDDENMNMLGIAYMETGDFESAMGIFYKLSIKYPKNHILLTNLAKCEAKCSKKTEAQEHIRQALMIFDDYKEALDLLEELNGK